MSVLSSIFLRNVSATTEIYTYLHTLALHDALPIYALHARGDGHLALVADVDGTGRIFADQHHGQPRLAPGLGDEGADPVRDLAAKRLRKGLAVDDLADGHDASPCYSIMVESRPEANASPPDRKSTRLNSSH